MFRSARITFVGCWAALVIVHMPVGAQEGLESRRPDPLYEYREDHDPNGTGKFFMGREIALVMGHQGADWLDRPEREEEEEPQKLLDALELKPGMVVADIGAGTGYITLRLARRVAPGGKVFAVDIQPEMLTLLRNRMKSQGVSNVDLVQGTILDPKLPPASTDLILMVDVYHEFSHPWEMTQAMIRALRPRGKLVFVEYRGEDPTVPIKRVHKMTEHQVRKEMALHPLRWVKTIDGLPRQHIIVFETRGSEDAEGGGPRTQKSSAKAAASDKRQM